MTDIATALTELGVDEWVLRGEPTSEAEFNEMFRKVTGADSNGSAIESDNPDDFGTTWSAVSAKKTELVNAEPMRLLREERNRRIAETDWMGNSDVTMSDAWKTYRQELRDITKSATSLDDVTWPTKPSQEIKMPDITVSLTDTELKCLEYAAAVPQDWADNALTNRARIAKDEIIAALVAHCNANDVAIATGEDAQVAQAFDLKVVKKASEIEDTKPE